MELAYYSELYEVQARILDAGKGERQQGEEINLYQTVFCGECFFKSKQRKLRNLSVGRGYYFARQVERAMMGC